MNKVLKGCSPIVVLTPVILHSLSRLGIRIVSTRPRNPKQLWWLTSSTVRYVIFSSRPPATSSTQNIITTSMDTTLPDPCRLGTRNVNIYLLNPPSEQKRERTESTQKIFTKSALTTIERLRSYIESAGLELPVGEGDIDRPSVSAPARTTSFRADVTNRDRCCPLTGKQNQFGGARNNGYVGPAIDAYHTNGLRTLGLQCGPRGATPSYALRPSIRMFPKMESAYGRTCIIFSTRSFGL